MLPVYRAIYSAYSKGFHDLADHRSDDWFLMGSPWPVLCITAFYVYFVTSLGPRFMKNRSAFHVDPIVRVYNLLQIFLSLSVFILALSIGWGTSHSPFCNPIDYSDSEIPIREARAVWLYFILKLLDLCDTIFFVLRKKMQQVSFLHVYHHAAMLVTAWLITKFLPGGHATFVGVANCFVHVVMYSYYFVTSMWPEKRNGLWWKKHITQLQMLQFVLVGLHASSSFLIEDCDYPRAVGLAVVVQSAFMSVMFYDFYQKAYGKKNKNC